MAAKAAVHAAPQTAFSINASNENERYLWYKETYERKNADVEKNNHYDFSRKELNFEIIKGKIKPLGLQEKRLYERLQERLENLSFKTYKDDAQNKPNCCVDWVFSGDHDRMCELAFGKNYKSIDYTAETDNTRAVKETAVYKYLHEKSNPKKKSKRSKKKVQEPEIYKWAREVYKFACKKWGEENIIGMEVHLDETTPHAHILMVPVAMRKARGRASTKYEKIDDPTVVIKKSEYESLPETEKQNYQPVSKKSKELVSYSGVFGDNYPERKEYMKQFHTDFFEEVGRQFGLERGDDLDTLDPEERRKRRHMRKDQLHAVQEYDKKIEEKKKELETDTIKHKELTDKNEALTTKNKELETSISQYTDKLEQVELDFDETQMDVWEAENSLKDINEEINSQNQLLTDIQSKLAELPTVEELEERERRDKAVPSLKDIIERENRNKAVPSFDEIILREKRDKAVPSLKDIIERENRNKAVPSFDEIILREKRDKEVPSLDDIIERERRNEKVPSLKDIIKRENRNKVIPTDEQLESRRKRNLILPTDAQLNNRARRDKELPTVEQLNKREVRDKSLPTESELDKREERNNILPTEKQLDEKEREFASVTTKLKAKQDELKNLHVPTSEEIALARQTLSNARKEEYAKLSLPNVKNKIDTTIAPMKGDPKHIYVWAKIDDGQWFKAALSKEQCQDYKDGNATQDQLAALLLSDIIIREVARNSFEKAKEFEKKWWEPKLTARTVSLFGEMGNCIKNTIDKLDDWTKILSPKPTPEELNNLHIVLGFMVDTQQAKDRYEAATKLCNIAIPASETRGGLWRSNVVDIVNAVAEKGTQIDIEYGRGLKR